MGSSGSGQFGNYAPTEEPKCEKPLEFDLEEVGRSEFYSRTRKVPTPGTAVHLAPLPVDKRLVVIESGSDATLGLVPTKLNFLLACMGRGFRYSGEVVESRGGKVPSVKVRLAPAT